MIISEERVRRLIRNILFESKKRSRAEYEEMLDASKKKVKS